MVVAQLLSALQPWAFLLTFVVVLAVLWGLLRGAVHRTGTTEHLSDGGIAATLMVLGLLAVFLIVESYAEYGGLLLFFVLVVGVFWGLSAARGRTGRPSRD
jgi:hypothetical protein